MARKNKKRKLLSVAVGVLCLIISACVYFGGELPSFSSSSDKTLIDKDADFVRMLDVGQGDCALIYSNGRTALIDTGTVNSSNDICMELNGLGIKSIDLLMLSHLHSDHTGGVERIVDTFSVKNLILPELSTFSEGMSAAQYAINAVTRSKGGVFTAVQGMNFNVGEFEVTVLAAYDDDEENNRSVFAMAELDGRKFLFTGDAETKVEKLLLKEKLNIKCDVLKVGHHGSTTSSSNGFLDAAAPSYAAISVGADNSYGHPHKEIISAFKTRNVNVLRTDEKGSITFYVKNGKIEVQTEK